MEEIYKLLATWMNEKGVFWLKDLMEYAYSIGIDEKRTTVVHWVKKTNKLQCSEFRKGQRQYIVVEDITYKDFYKNHQ